MTDHIYCLDTGYCVVCGNHEESLVYHGIGCVPASANVSGITHLRRKAIQLEERDRAAQRFAELHAEFVASLVTKEDTE